MGGNARAIDIKTGNVVSIFEREAYAQQIDLRNIDIVLFRKNIEDAFEALDHALLLHTGTSLWPSSENRKNIFLGSAALVWDESFFTELLTVKTTLGDVDVAVPQDRLGDLFDVLQILQGKTLSENIIYVGQNRQKLRKPQINAIFAWNETLVQVDFVGLPFTNDKPDRFVTFARSSPKEDILRGVKGVAHKYLLMTLAWVCSHRDDIVVLTDKSLLPPHKYRLKTMHEPVRCHSFSIDRGFRERLEVCLKPGGGGAVRIDGKMACKELQTSESTYITDLELIFQQIFNRVPSSHDLEEFSSFQGLIRLANRYLSEKMTTKALEQMLRYKLYGPGQAMSRLSSEEDKRIKENILSVAKSWCPDFSQFDDETKKLQIAYYAKYNGNRVEE